MSTQMLHLTGQELSVLPNGVPQISGLQQLYAGGNRFVDATSVFLCPELLLADLAWNDIQLVPASIRASKLVSVNLSHNCLCNLQATLTSLSQLPALRILLLKGNPLCLQAGYTTSVQHQLPNLQHFDGNPVMWQQSNHKTSPGEPTSAATVPTSPPAPRPRSALKHSRGASAASKTCLSSSLGKAVPEDNPKPAGQGTESDSIAALHSPASASVSPIDCSIVLLQLQVQLTQLTVSNATSAESIPAADTTATEAAPPLYRYFLQLRTLDGALCAGWPLLMIPNTELVEWQAKLAAEVLASGKKAAKKPAAVKGGKADANSGGQVKPWYDQGSLQANFPIAADVPTQIWLRSGMTVQLMRSAAPVPSKPGTDPQEKATEAAAVDKPCCIARGVVQAGALLDGVTRDVTIKLDLQTDVPLFSENNIRLGLDDPSIQMKQEASLSVSLKLQQADWQVAML